MSHRHRYWNPTELGLAGWSTAAVVNFTGAVVPIPRHCAALCFFVFHTSPAFVYRLRFYVKDLAGNNIAVGAFPGETINVGASNNPPAQSTCWAMAPGFGVQWGQQTGGVTPIRCGSIVNAERIQPIIEIIAGGAGTGNCYMWGLFKD